MERLKFLSHVWCNRLILYPPQAEFTTLADEGQLGERRYCAGKSKVNVRVVSHPKGGEAHLECTFTKNGKNTPQVGNVYLGPGDPAIELPGGGRVQHLK